MGKIILITGCSSGFGKLMAKTLAKNGHTVFASMRDSDAKNAKASEELINWGKENNFNLNVVDLDVTKNDTIKSAVSSIMEKAGKIDIVVNNAGFVTAGIQEAVTIEQMKSIYDVNVFGSMRVVKAVLPIMRKQGEGLVIQISSGLGRTVFPFLGIYASTKWAVEALNESYNMELSKLGIEFALVEPGAYPTDIFKNMVMPGDDQILSNYGEMANMPKKMFEGMGKMFEGPNAPNPQDVADAVQKLIDMDGNRPLRTVVDNMGGEGIEAINSTSEKVQQQFLEAYGLK